MKRTMPIALLALWGLSVGTIPAFAGVQVGLSVDRQGVSGFTLAIGDYYRVPQEQITLVRNYRIPDEELAVVFFISQRGHVTPERVIKARRAGKTWAQVAYQFGVGPEAFYVVSTRVDGPFGRAYGLYGKTPKDRWNSIQLHDADIVNFVNLRFLSDRNQCRPETIVQMRGAGYGFARIHENLSQPKRPAGHEKLKPQPAPKKAPRPEPRISMAPKGPVKQNRRGR